MPHPRRLTPAIGLLLTAAPLPAQDHVAGTLVQLDPNGAWSWFEDERAVVDATAGLILVGSCADASGFAGAERSGDIDVAWLDLAGGSVGRFTLHPGLQADDQDSPALLIRPDGHYLAMYGMHGGRGTAPRLSRWRISKAAGDPSAWRPEQHFEHSRSMSYSNLHHLPGAGRTWNFVRAVNFDPNTMWSADLGDDFEGAGKLLTEGGNGDRPYVKYANDGSTRVHLITTERHPRDFDNSVHHGYVEGTALHDSHGEVIDADVRDGDGHRPAALTPVFRTGTVVGGVAMHRAWTIDLCVDAGGSVRALFQARADDDHEDHRLFEARLRDGAWSVHEVCALGAGLYAREQDYTGLAALHPDRSDRLFVSTPIDPRDGSLLSHHEIFAGVTPDGGASWAWSPVTAESSVDNLRPIVPAWDGEHTALLWLRGDYTSYTDYDTAVVGTVTAPELAVAPLRYVDATPANTRGIDGAAVEPTGPDEEPGARDDRWHRRQGFGNGGSVWTSDERGDEDAPTLRTRLTGLAPGRYDVFALFWSNPAEDWLLRAGHDPGSLRTVRKRAAEAAETADFVAAADLVRHGPTVALYRTWLGRRTVGDDGALDVYVDDLPAGQSSANRCWYDGLAVAPAPSNAKPPADDGR